MTTTELETRDQELVALVRDDCWTEMSDGDLYLMRAPSGPKYVRVGMMFDDGVLCVDVLPVHLVVRLLVVLEYLRQEMESAYNAYWQLGEDGVRGREWRQAIRRKLATTNAIARRRNDHSA